jgi:hypothetical protein
MPTPQPSKEPPPPASNNDGDTLFGCAQALERDVQVLFRLIQAQSAGRASEPSRRRMSTNEMVRLAAECGFTRKKYRHTTVFCEEAAKWAASQGFVNLQGRPFTANTINQWLKRS